MAGDWIKMRSALYTDPKVMSVGKFLEGDDRFCRWLSCGEDESVTLCDGALRYLVTGALHNVWCNANEHATDDVVIGATLEWVDEIAGIVNFGSAMESVGWIEVLKTGVRFPKFNRHNTPGAERQKRFRDKHRNKRDVTCCVTDGGTSNGREEKRREDKNTPKVPKGTESKRRNRKPVENDDPNFEKWWNVYPRKVQRRPALEAWLKAKARLLERHPDWDDAKARMHLGTTAKAFADSPAGQAGKFCPHPASWLNADQFDDDQTAWQADGDKPSLFKDQDAVYPELAELPAP
jgi:hypothetical protein